MAPWFAILAVILSALIPLSASQQCATLLTISNTQRNYSLCQSLTQGASIAWTFFSDNATLDIAFTGSLGSSSGWAGWGYNPQKAAMDGTSALIAYNNASGAQLNLYSVSDANKGGAALNPTSSTADVLRIISRSVQIGSNDAVSFTALLQLRSGSNSSIFQIWNKGSSMSGDSPGSHPIDAEHKDSVRSLDLATGAASGVAVIPPSASPSPASQQCATLLTISNTQRSYSLCQSLTQGASIAWTFFRDNATLDIAFTGILGSSSGWAGWGYNPQNAVMDGTSALIAYNNASGAQLNLYSVSGANKGGAPLNPTSATADVLRIISRSVQISSNDAVSFTALLQLRSGSSSSIFQIWNKGSSMSGDSPGSHPIDAEHKNSARSLDLATGAASGVAVPRLRLKNAHGLLCAIGWGILLPLGAMLARYMRSFEWADPTWFYLHVGIQSLGYILGVVGWAIGLNLGSDSPGVRYNTHRNIGIAIFVFGTLQVFAIGLRPNKTHQYRKFWNVYHHSLGYATIALSIVNIFKGFEILQPAKGWKRAYIGIIIALGVMALVFEVITWIAYLRRRKSSSRKNNTSNNPYHVDDDHQKQQDHIGLRV